MLTAEYAARLDGYSEECRQVSYSIAKALSQLSASTASTTSQAIHRLHAQHRRKADELRNTRTAVSLLVMMETAVEQCRAVNEAIERREFRVAHRHLSSAKDGLKEMREAYALSSSAVFRHLEVSSH